METQQDIQPKTQEQEWKEFMPPDDYVPEWKKQFQAIERQTMFKRLSERIMFVALGAALAIGATFLFSYPLLVQALVVLVLIVFAMSVWMYAILMRLRAAEIDNKLNEEVRIEPIVKTGNNTMAIAKPETKNAKPYEPPKIRDLGTVDDKARALGDELKA